MAVEAGHHASRAYFTRDGAIDLNGAALYDSAGNDMSKVIAGLTTGVKIKHGEITLDGTNPTSVATGLASIVAATASFKTATALGDDPNALSVDYGGSVAAGQLDIYAWKNTSGTDPTQVASTNNAIVISYIAIGT